MGGKLDGRVAIVTGGSRGIGRAVATAYVAEGARVALVARHQGPLQDAVEDLRRAGGQVVGISADVSQEAGVAQVVARTREVLGPVDILINNAGVLTPKGAIHDIVPSDWDVTMAANLRGPFLMMRAVLPEMLARRRGVILNVSSGAGKRASPGWGPYAVSKFGIEGLTKAAAAETQASGVRVNAVNPGGVRTAMRAMAYPQEDPTTLPAPEEIAPLFVWLASDEADGITGESVDWREWRLRA